MAVEASPNIQFGPKCCSAALIRTIQIMAIMEAAASRSGFAGANLTHGSLRMWARVRANNLVTVGGETKCMAEWVELTGIKRGTLQFRIKNHWPESRLFDKANPILGRFTARGTPRPVA